MTAKEIVQKRMPTMSEEDVDFYIDMAETRVRGYLGDETADLAKYSLQIADIAILYYQKDTSNNNAAKTLGYSREVFREGAVSAEKAGMTGASVQSTYDKAIDDLLLNLDGTAHILRLL